MFGAAGGLEGVGDLASETDGDRPCHSESSSALRAGSAAAGSADNS